MYNPITTHFYQHMSMQERICKILFEYVHSQIAWRRISSKLYKVFIFAFLSFFDSQLIVSIWRHGILVEYFYFGFEFELHSANIDHNNEQMLRYRALNENI